MKVSVYFKNLNALRFIAALLVIIHHLEQIKSFFTLSNSWSNPFIKEIGGLGVTLFFVLSGFLITYLLLKEKQETTTISIRDFYIRRVLRIWPLYYLIVLFSFFVFPHLSFFSIPGFSNIVFENFTSKFLLFLLFFPNIASVLYTIVPFASQAWSVGVEEQFYLIWPVLVKKFKSSLTMLVGVILFYLFVKFSLIHIAVKLHEYPGFMRASYFWNNFKVDCMAIGGLSAYILFHNKQKLMDVLFNKYLQITIYIVTFFLIGTSYNFPLFNSEMYSVFFSYIILNLAANPNTILKLENKLFNYLGKISYGLYMYHGICIVASLRIASYFNFNSNIFIYTVCLMSSIALSSLSYELFELRFIRLKKKYSKILSGAEVEEPMPEKK